ncbi:MAG TPA: DUF6438 domain-containing protein [Saprospiraceae bacterium]|nr:DUF6438 domain-containing protein [Saprospiraceae bacterium]
MASHPFHSFTLILCLSLLLGCAGTKAGQKNKPFELQHWITVQKNPCFGHCQVYKMSIYRNGLVIFEGREHTEKIGVYFTELNPEKIKSYKRLLDSPNWTSYQDEYMVNIADLPVTDIQYFNVNGARIKNIKANSNLPDPVQAITKEISNLIKLEKWTQIQRKSEMNNPEVIDNEFIVDMDTTLTSAGLETEFLAYDLKSLKRISPHMNLWSFRFDESKIGKFEMMVLLRKKSGIRSVQFNRRILPRE